MIETPGRFHSKATDHVVAGANEILDDILQKKQSEINAGNENFKEAQAELNEAQSDFNSEVREALGTGGNVDERIVNAVKTEKDRAEGAEEALDGRVDTLEDAVGTGGSVDSRISSAVNEAKSEIKGNATSACDTLGEAEALIAAEATRAGAAEVALDTAKADKATTLAGYGITDAYTKSETYSKTEINDHIDTPNQGYVTAIADSNTTTANLKSLIDTAAGSDKEKAEFIYRVGCWDGSQYNDTMYSEYAWIDTDYVFLSKKSQIDEVFDISAYHANTPYIDLAAALDSNNGGGVPQSLQKGGMSVKFIQGSVQSSDNKYVQYRLMANTFSTNESDWQGVDAEPTAGSDNLIKSGGVYNSIFSVKAKVGKILLSQKDYCGYYVVNTNTGALSIADSDRNGFMLEVDDTLTYKIKGKFMYANMAVEYSSIPSTSTFIGKTYGITETTYKPRTGTKYIVLTLDLQDLASEYSIVCIDNINSQVLSEADSYVICNSAANKAVKEVDISSMNFIIKSRIVIKFTNDTTSDTYASLKIIDSKKEMSLQKPLFYCGSAANNYNSWDAGDVLDVYYDSINERFDATPHYKNVNVVNEIEEKYTYSPVITRIQSGKSYLNQVKSIVLNYQLPSVLPEDYVTGSYVLTGIYVHTRTTTNLRLVFYVGVLDGASVTGSKSIIVNLYPSSSSKITVRLSNDSTYDYGTLVIDKDYLWNLELSSGNYIFNNLIFNLIDSVEFNTYLKSDYFKTNSFDGGKLKDNTVDESKLKEPLRNKINKKSYGFLNGKTLVTLCDSMGNTNQWQTLLAELTGAVYDAEVALRYSRGGTQTFNANQVGGDAQSRAKQLVEDGLITPDVIIYENVNDNSHAPSGSNSDEPFMRSNQEILSISPLSDLQAATDYWNNNFATIVQGYTPAAGTIIGVPYEVTNKSVKIKITGAALNAGNFGIGLTSLETKNISVEAGDTISTIVSKILDYDWPLYVDIQDPNDPDAVIFTRTDNPSYGISANIYAGDTGITSQVITTGVVGELCYWRCFYGHDLTKWSNSDNWVESISRWSMWKGIIEYLQTNFKNAIIYWLLPRTWSYDMDNPPKFQDGTINYSAIQNTYNTYSALFVEERAFCDFYGIPYIDLPKLCGINPMNSTEYCSSLNVHPKQAGYDRWAEIIAKQIG